MNNSIVIGLGYKARHGKGTAAQAIVDARGDKYDILNVAFADALRQEVNDAIAQNGGMLGLFTRMQNVLPDWVKYDPNALVDETYPHGKQRTLLQWWGTEYRRKSDPFYWVKKMEQRIERENRQIVLINDLRFPNEYFYISRQRKGHTIKVGRYGFRLLDPVAASHPSESALDGFTFDYEINCQDGEVEQLKKDAVTVFDMIIDSLNPPHTDFATEEEVPDGTAPATTLQVVQMAG